MAPMTMCIWCRGSRIGLIAYQQTRNEVHLQLRVVKLEAPESNDQKDCQSGEKL